MAEEKNPLKSITSSTEKSSWSFPVARAIMVVAGTVVEIYLPGSSIVVVPLMVATRALVKESLRQKENGISPITDSERTQAISHTTVNTMPQFPIASPTLSAITKSTEFVSLTKESLPAPAGGELAPSHSNTAQENMLVNKVFETAYEVKLESDRNRKKSSVPIVKIFSPPNLISQKNFFIQESQNSKKTEEVNTIKTPLSKLDLHLYSETFPALILINQTEETSEIYQLINQDALDIIHSKQQDLIEKNDKLTQENGELLKQNAELKEENQQLPGLKEENRQLKTELQAEKEKTSKLMQKIDQSKYSPALPNEARSKMKHSSSPKMGEFKSSRFFEPSNCNNDAKENLDCFVASSSQ